ncbi:MAG: NADH:ubiquinone reductase (Na(+)-transporting) subunit A, partial [bacterium]|nr:NADH:ubiquinone reductase (Na(+)-transporting) subunit A [bacterium]
MGRHKIKRGLKLPISGEPVQTIEVAPTPSRVALLADDYVGMRPTMHVAEGDDVRRGQLLFEDKKTPGVHYTAPASGQVVAINRGERRRLQSLLIDLDQSELGGGADTVAFESYTGRHPKELRRQQVKDLLIESGMWTALRTKPYSKVPKPDTAPRSVFVQAMDTNPLAPPVKAAIKGREEDLERGLEVVAKLTDGPVYVCQAPGSSLPVRAADKFRIEEFTGPHPAGTPGVHIHHLD